MKKFFSRAILSVCLTLGLTLASYASASAFNPFAGTCSSAPSASSSAVCSDSATQGTSTVDPIYHTIQTAANIIALLGGIIAVITIMIGGLNYVTSSGDQEKIKSAKTRILGAIIGLAILAAAYTITTFGVNLVK